MDLIVSFLLKYFLILKTNYKFSYQWTIWNGQRRKKSEENDKKASKWSMAFLSLCAKLAINCRKHLAKRKKEKEVEKCRGDTECANICENLCRSLIGCPDIVRQIVNTIYVGYYHTLRFIVFWVLGWRESFFVDLCAGLTAAVFSIPTGYLYIFSLSN